MYFSYNNSSCQLIKSGLPVQLYYISTIIFCFLIPKTSFIFLWTSTTPPLRATYIEIQLTLAHGNKYNSHNQMPNINWSPINAVYNLIILQTYPATWLHAEEAMTETSWSQSGHWWWTLMEWSFISAWLIFTLIGLSVNGLLASMNPLATITHRKTLKQKRILVATI